MNNAMSKFAQMHAVLYSQDIRVAAHLGGHLRRGPPPVTLRLHTAQLHSGTLPTSTERFTADTAHSIPDTFADTYYYAGEREMSNLELTLTLTPTFQPTITSAVLTFRPVGETINIHTPIFESVFQVG